MVVALILIEFHCVGLSNRFYDPSVLPALREIDFEKTSKEYAVYTGYQNLPWPEKHLYDERKGEAWNVTPLIGFGKINHRIKKHFPETFASLEKIPGLKTAAFSILGPGTALTPHQGWAELSNWVLRCHMGIEVPSEARSGVKVEGQFKQSELGKWMVFDDSKVHLGINDSPNENRVVLLLDIERPWFVRRGVSKVPRTRELDGFINLF